jgi:glycosyltransferase involved in cell wall biosynthesis
VLFALPSVARSEAFCIVQIEAMEAGVPVVNTSLDSGVPYVSLHEQTGLTLPPGDSGALPTALNRLLDDSDMRRSFGSAARQRARQEFALETMTARTLAVRHGYEWSASYPSSIRIMSGRAKILRQAYRIPETNRKQL